MVKGDPTTNAPEVVKGKVRGRPKKGWKPSFDKGIKNPNAYITPERKAAEQRAAERANSSKGRAQQAEKIEKHRGEGKEKLERSNKQPGEAEYEASKRSSQPMIFEQEPTRGYDPDTGRNNTKLGTKY